MPAEPFVFETFLAATAAQIGGYVALAIAAGLGIWAITYGVKVGISKFAGFARKG